MGVVGTGAMGQHHARIYYELPGVELVAVADVNERSAKKNAEPYGAEYYTDYKELLNKVDGVSIAVPTTLHKEVALQFLSKGVHVLIEKPIASTLEEADRMIDAAKQSNVLLAVGHVERFNPGVRKLNDVLKNEKIIQVGALRCGPSIKNRDESVGSVIFDLMTHDIDVMRYLIKSEPTDIVARGGKLNSEYDNYATALITLENGVLATFSANRITQKKIRKLLVTCEDKLIELDYINQNIEVYREAMPEYKIEGGKMTYKQENIVEKVEVQKKEPLKMELQNFVNCIKNHEEPEVSGVVGKKTLEIALRVEEAMK